MYIKIRISRALIEVLGALTPLPLAETIGSAKAEILLICRANSSRWSGRGAGDSTLHRYGAAIFGDKRSAHQVSWLRPRLIPTGTSTLDCHGSMYSWNDF